MTLCILHSHSFVCGRNIFIKFTLPLIDEKCSKQQIMPCHFIGILVFLGSFLCRTLYVTL